MYSSLSDGVTVATTGKAGKRTIWFHCTILEVPEVHTFPGILKVPGLKLRLCSPNGVEVPGCSQAEASLDRC